MEVVLEAVVGNRLGAGIYRRWVDALGFTGAEHVLEIGTGSGACARHLAAALPTGRPVCVDLDARWLAIAHRAASTPPQNNRVGHRAHPFLDRSMNSGDLGHQLCMPLRPKERPVSLNALFLNCTLKASPEPSNTQALIDKVAGIMGEMGVSSATVRVADHKVRFGVSSDEGQGDEWPGILEQIKACDILVVAMPIWFGVRSSVAQLVLERLDGTYAEGDPATGQYPLYGKVAGVIVTGNEDGAHDCCANTLYNLTHLGCMIPPNVDCYWVGDAGPGPSYIEAGGDRHLYTNRTARYMAHNLVWGAKALRECPIGTDLKALDAEAGEVSG